MSHEYYDDHFIADILKGVRTIALLGASPKPDRPSYGVMRFLLAHGYTVHPVNPGIAGKEILGRKVYATLSDVPQPVDMIDIFRSPQYLPSIVEEVLALPHRPKVLWGQLGVYDEAAAREAEAGGIAVIMDRCPAIEYSRLIG